MKVVVAIDSFKGSMTSLEAGHAAKEGVLRACPDATVQVMPIADGGEGTVEVLTEGLGGTYRTLTVTGPLGIPIRVRYGVLANGKTAVMDMAAAALTAVPADKRNPLNTTTYGVGEMMVDALDRGCEHIVLGIGGSATNDGGTGMLQALGFDLTDKQGEPIPFGAKALLKLCTIDDRRVHPRLNDCRISVACDVQNPLCGETGCSAVFAPQKGASPDMVWEMDRWLRHYAALVKTVRPDADPDLHGAGAAGGMGFALATFLNATLQNGIALILEQIGLEEAIRQADVVLTGEGRLDAQTAMGKAPVGVATLAKKHQKPVLAFGGGVTAEAVACRERGIDAFFSIVRGACTLQEAMEPHTARANMTATVEEVFRTVTAMGGNTK
ncbi:MAG: glycerate kinase [Clostridia bacterium]|nr:glycerate kinase [Clostridia bacterium]